MTAAINFSESKDGSITPYLGSFQPSEAVKQEIASIVNLENKEAKFSFSIASDPAIHKASKKYFATAEAFLRSAFSAVGVTDIYVRRGHNVRKPPNEDWVRLELLVGFEPGKGSRLKKDKQPDRLAETISAVSDCLKDRGAAEPLVAQYSEVITRLADEVLRGKAIALDVAAPGSWVKRTEPNVIANPAAFPPIPSEAPKKWVEREDKKESAKSFIAREYKDWLQEQTPHRLGRGQLARLDQACYRALTRWEAAESEKRGEAVKLGASFGFRDEKSKKITTDAEIEAFNAGFRPSSKRDYDRVRHASKAR